MSQSLRPLWLLGLDLGQAQDHSALAVLQRTAANRILSRFNRDSLASVSLPGPSYYYDLRLLERFPLNTSYYSVIDRVRSVLAKPEITRPASLIVDATGAGAPVVEMIRKQPLPANLIPVVITSGNAASLSAGSYRVPKRELISNLSLLLENGSLRFSHKLPASAQLLRELTVFRTAMSRNGSPTYSAPSGEHDDLVLALALALWWGRPQPACGEQHHGPLF